MKILFVSSHIYDRELYRSKGAANGLAIMLRAILDELAKYNNCYAYATNSFTRKRTNKNLNILSSRKIDGFRALKLKDYWEGLFQMVYGLTALKSFFFSRMISRLFLKYYHEIMPDLINFHDLTPANIELVSLCNKLSIKYVITDHLYIGSDGWDSNNYMRDAEKAVFSRENITISVVSSGVKKRLLYDFPCLSEKQIWVIANGTRLEYLPGHNINKDRIKFICIGNIMARKNQIQLLKAIQLLSKEVRGRILVEFIGADLTHCFEKQIEEMGCSDVAKYRGEVPFESMSECYRSADYTITVSLNEGFGLTIIEGFVYGVPAILYEDLDSFDDIYDDKSCLAIRERDDLSLAKALERAINLRDTWDRDYIQEYSEKFSMQQVGKKFVEMFNDIINNSYNDNSSLIL